MSKFRYYVTDMYAGAIVGTDDTDAAMNCAGCEDYFVVDTETGCWLQPGGPVEVEPLAQA